MPVGFLAGEQRRSRSGQTFQSSWSAPFVRGRRRLVGLISWVTAGALFVEMALTAGAAALGTTGHINVSTPLHATVWYTMAASIVVGLHGLQALPLFGYLLALFAPDWLRTGHRVALVWTAGLSYLGLVGVLTRQAPHGQPLISPDARTLGALFALVLTAGTAASAVVLRARRGKRGWPERDQEGVGPRAGHGRAGTAKGGRFTNAARRTNG
jgi:hypothetical protein